MWPHNRHRHCVWPQMQQIAGSVNSMMKPPNARSAKHNFVGYATARNSALQPYFGACSLHRQKYGVPSGDRASPTIATPPKGATFDNTVAWHSILVRGEEHLTSSISTTTRPRLSVRRGQPIDRRSHDPSSPTIGRINSRSRKPNLTSSRCISQTFWTSFSAPVAEVRGAS